MVTFSAIHCNCQSIGNMKVKFWGYNEKNMDFHLTPEKRYYFRLNPGDEKLRMQYHFKWTIIGQNGILPTFDSFLWIVSHFMSLTLPIQSGYFEYHKRTSDD